MTWGLEWLVSFSLCSFHGSCLPIQSCYLFLSTTRLGSRGWRRGREGSDLPSPRTNPGVRNYRTGLFRDTRFRKGNQARPGTNAFLSRFWRLTMCGFTTPNWVKNCLNPSQSRSACFSFFRGERYEHTQSTIYTFRIRKIFVYIRF